MKAAVTTSSISPIKVNWRAAAGLTAALIVLFTTQNYLAPPVQPRGQQTLERVFVIQVINWATWLLLLPMIVKAAQRFRGPTGLRREQLPRQLLAAARIALTHGVIAGFVRWVAGVSVSKDPLEATINFTVVNFAASYFRYWLIATAYHALAYYQEARNREVSAARLETSLTQARLEALQGKLQPHFLFNTLNSIIALIRENPLAAETMVGNLGELLRASLSSTTSQEIPLGQELMLVEKYTDIERARFQERLRVDIEVPEQLRQGRVPHLLLQPLVENAIRHGLAPRESGGQVRITASGVNGKLRLQVIDDGVGVSTKPADGIGLSTTRERLEGLYGDQQRLDIEPGTPSGTVVTVELPWHTEPRA